MAGACLADVTVRLAMNVALGGLSLWEVCVLASMTTATLQPEACVSALCPKPQGCSLLPPGHVIQLVFSNNLMVPAPWAAAAKSQACPHTPVI